ncbi:hypothetical protein E2562_034880 [Oryza meyeriana var. granulata]|uniref:Uncharacterized protein n=1 Tax=Oryza meyeriana var. granulata TaxID=110450 RepID=A0A6G1C2R5_9ORYZ|nr:hypothetical protein E2562_034880 [Oryza meyeriana var. granulata]
MPLHVLPPAQLCRSPLALQPFCSLDSAPWCLLRWKASLSLVSPLAVTQQSLRVSWSELVIPWVLLEFVKNLEG